jgi:imidazolonepropionase-like amidohydrolase
MSDILFQNASVIDGSGRPPFRGDVIVRGNRVVAIGEGAAGRKTPDCETIDATGLTLMPGLVEPHAHPSFADTNSMESLGEIPPEEHTLLTMKQARKLLDQGFTSITSAGAAKPRLDIVVRNAINAGDIPGPRMLAASPELTVTAGFGDVRLHHLHRDTCSVIADGADEFRRVARFFMREGVDTVKINPSGDEFIPFARAGHTVMTEAEVAAVCEVAHGRGKRVAAHARSAESVKMCLRHGVEIIYHATLVDEEALDLLEAAKDRVFIGPTIGSTYTILHESAKFGVKLSPELLNALTYELEIACDNMRALMKRGVRVLPGGDYGFAWNPMGQNARDLEHFVNLFGCDPMDVLVAATKFGGEIMMKGDELGQVKEGYLADLLLVDGDPLQDIRVLQDKDRLVAIMKDGTFHKRPAIDAVRRRLAAE